MFTTRAVKEHVYRFCLALFFIAAGDTAFAQTTVNPDISFIGDTRATVTRQAPAEAGENTLRLDFHELEIAATGYLNPYARADVFIGFHEGAFEIEEAYATLLRGLPLNLQIKAGQYLVDVGRLNTQHPHQWSWIARPQMHLQYFGEDGLKAAGVNISTLAPIGSSALTLAGNLLQSASTHEHGVAMEEEEAHSNPQDLAYSGRVSLFVTLGEFTSLDVGISDLSREIEPDENLWEKLGALDLKLKWKPSIYQSLTLTAEGMVNRRPLHEHEEEVPQLELQAQDAHEESDLTFRGLFAAVDYQFKRRFNLGAFLDQAEALDEEKSNLFAYGIFAGFSLAEETYRVELLVRNDDSDLLEKSYQTFMLRLLWSLGPHKAHQF